MSTHKLRIPWPQLRNLRLSIRTFTDPQAYIDLRRQWGDRRDSVGTAACFSGLTTDLLWYDVDIIILLDKNTKRRIKSVLAHEATHAMQFISEYYGFKDDEFSAYGVEWIMEYAIEKGIA